MALKKKGILITFEGPEGSGKSTHMAALLPYLKKQGYSLVLTREPGGTRLAQELRRILLETREELTSLAELLIYEADRAQHIKEVVEPALRLGKIILCDRFTDSTLAYQGYGRQLDMKTIQTLNEIAAQKRVPDLTILLDVPVERGLRQAGRSKNGRDRLERAGLVFHKRVRAGYLKLAAQEPRRFRLIRQQADPAHTQQLIRRAVDHFLNKRRA
jgi:dTMP kinase